MSLLLIELSINSLNIEISMNASFDMYRSVSSKGHKRDEVTHPVSAKLFAHSNSTFRGRDNAAVFASPSRKSHTPVSVPATGSYRMNYGSLKDVPGPSTLVSFKYTGRQATELKDIKLFKNLVLFYFVQQELTC